MGFILCTDSTGISTVTSKCSDLTAQRLELAQYLNRVSGISTERVKSLFYWN